MTGRVEGAKTVYLLLAQAVLQSDGSYLLVFDGHRSQGADMVHMLDKGPMLPHGGAQSQG